MIYVFEVRMRPGCSAEDYADTWVRASRLIQQATGAKGTRLHRKLDDPDVLLAIASWEDKACRDAMERNLSERVKAIIAEQDGRCEIRVIGEFAEPEWVVEPGEG